MDRSVRLTYRYHDGDLVELTASAWNGEFGGSTRLYLGHGELAEAADVLAGFPQHVEDSREVTFGAFGPDSGAGAMALMFSCSDRAGHCQLRLTIEADPLLHNPPLQRVELLGAVEPAAVDQFVEQMKTLDSALVGSAVLSFAQ
jgi:hypothetical protein